MRKLCWYVGLISVIASCTTENKEKKTDTPPEEVEKVELYDAAREIHDEIMPYVDSLFNSKGIIKEELERASEGLKELNEQRRKALEEVVKELEQADESMFDWMHDYGAMPDDTLSYEEIISKLEKSLEEINATKRLMLKSLEKASKLISGDSLDNQ